MPGLQDARSAPHDLPLLKAERQLGLSYGPPRIDLPLVGRVSIPLLMLGIALTTLVSGAVVLPWAAYALLCSVL